MTELPLIPPPPSNQPEPGFVVLGRFQPFHKGHAAMIIAAEARAHAGIGNDYGIITLQCSQ